MNGWPLGSGIAPTANIPVENAPAPLKWTTYAGKESAPPQSSTDSFVERSVENPIAGACRTDGGFRLARELRRSWTIDSGPPTDMGRGRPADAPEDDGHFTVGSAKAASIGRTTQTPARSPIRLALTAGKPPRTVVWIRVLHPATTAPHARSPLDTTARSPQMSGRSWNRGADKKRPRWGDSEDNASWDVLTAYSPKRRG